MSLFSRLFQKTPPAAPLDATPPEQDAPRIEAVGRLPDGVELRGIAGLADRTGAVAPIALQRAAQSRLAHLVDEGSIDFAEFCQHAKNQSALFAVAALCEDAGRLPQALALIHDPSQIAQLVTDSPSGRLRQLAAHAVHDPLLLKALLKQVRGKDKSVYRIIRQKCDAQAAAERRAADFAHEVSSLVAALERHSHRVHDDFYAATLEQMSNRWHALQPRPDIDSEQRAVAAMERCRAAIAQHLRDVALRAAQAATDQAAQHAIRDALELERHAALQAAAARAFEETQAQQEREAIRRAESAVIEQKQAAEEQVLRQVAELIGKADTALKDGNTQRAAGLRAAIQQKWSTVPGMPAHMARDLHQLDEKLRDLKQWKDYAVAPKRAALIAEMAGLVGSTEDPPTLAARIKSLQQEWRTISKGIVSGAASEADRFHQASQAAYRPCREYFELQAQLRRENLAQRKSVLARLMAFEDRHAEHADWGLMTRVLHEAPQEFRRYVPVDREAGRAIQAEFDAVMGRLHNKLDGWHEGNVADKQALIEQARQLVQQDAGRAAFDAVKRLQILWKDTGPAPRDRSQALWYEFRELCDTIYHKQQQAHAAYLSAAAANKAGAVALCEKAEQGATLTGAALLEAGAKIPEWRAAFDALDEMPRADARALHDRFDRAIDACRAQIARQQSHENEQIFGNVFESARRMRIYEWAVLTQVDHEEHAALKQATEAFIAGVPRWPKKALKTLNETLANAHSLSPAECASRERALRTLCIHCEIRSDTPTPPEDQALRREYQVRRLTRAMGQGTRTEPGDWDDTLLEWVRIGGIPPDVHENLQKRFMGSWAKRGEYSTIRG